MSLELLEITRNYLYRIWSIGQIGMSEIFGKQHTAQWGAVEMFPESFMLKYMI